jgi:hypothetical protein
MVIEKSVLIQERFRSSIERGTGEAHLILKENLDIDFSRFIIKASIRNCAYDPQCEGDRSIYLSELISISPQKEAIIEELLKILLNKRSDDWGLVQLFELVRLFAEDGNLKAREILLKRFEKNSKPSYQFAGQHSIIALEGISGLIKVAEIRGKILMQDKEDWEDSWVIDDFQSANRRLKVYDILEKEAKSNVYIKTYLDSVKNHIWSLPKRQKRKKYSYKVLNEKIKTGPLRGVLEKVKIDLSERDIKRLADDFLRENDRKKQESYLKIFEHIKYPYHYHHILDIAKGKDSKEDRCKYFALEALRHFEGEDLRRYAVQKINKLKNPSLYLPLLVSNYREGDHKMLASIAERNNNYDAIHSIVCGLIDIYIANPTPECKEPLEAMYNKLNCGIHREDVIRILKSNGVLSNKIEEELQYDSYTEIRKLARKS